MKHLLWIAMLLLQMGKAEAQTPDNFLQLAMNAEKFPGLCVAVIKDGHWIYNRNLGKADLANNTPMSRETPLMSSTVGNAMIATAVMQLAEHGRLRLSDDVNKYLPFKLQNPYYPTDVVTIQMLLTHTAALQDDNTLLQAIVTQGDSPTPLADFLRAYLEAGGSYYSQVNNFYNNPPGLQWNYSNIGISLAAYIVERVAQDNFSHYCDTAIFSKLCMDNTSFMLAGFKDTGKIARPYTLTNNVQADQGLYGHPLYPALQLRTDVTGLTRFMTMYMQYGRYEGTRLLDSMTVLNMMQPLAQASAPLDVQGIGFYGPVTPKGDTIWGQEGLIWGSVSAMYFNYKNEVGVVMLANGEGTTNPRLILDSLYKYGLTVTPTANDTFPACTHPVSITNIDGETTDIQLYPNPAHRTIQVNMPYQGKMVMMNLQGQTQATFTLKAAYNSIQLPAIPVGIYIVYIYDAEGNLQVVKKLVCQP